MCREIFWKNSHKTLLEIISGWFTHSFNKDFLALMPFQDDQRRRQDVPAFTGAFLLEENSLSKERNRGTGRRTCTRHGKSCREISRWLWQDGWLEETRSLHRWLLCREGTGRSEGTQGRSLQGHSRGRIWVGSAKPHLRRLRPKRASPEQETSQQSMVPPAGQCVYCSQTRRKGMCAHVYNYILQPTPKIYLKSLRLHSRQTPDHHHM